MKNKEIGSCFDTVTGEKIHFCNVRKLEIFYLDDVPVMLINGIRVYNNKHNKKVAQMSDKYFRINNFKTVVFYQKVNDEDIKKIS